MRIHEIDIQKQKSPMSTKSVSKLEDPLKKQADNLRDRAGQYDDEADELGDRYKIEKAQKNVQDTREKVSANRKERDDDRN